jgi:hypothetical protein
MPIRTAFADGTSRTCSKSQANVKLAAAKTLAKALAKALANQKLPKNRAKINRNEKKT